MYGMARKLTASSLPWTIPKSCMRFRSWAMSVSYFREASGVNDPEWKRGKYQLQPPCVRFIPQVLPEIKIVHIPVGDTEGMFSGGKDPHEEHYFHACTVQKDAHADLIKKPL